MTSPTPPVTSANTAADHPTPTHFRRIGFDPDPAIATLRRERPVTRVATYFGDQPGEAWLITRHEDVRAVLGDATTFSSRRRPMLDRLRAAGVSEEQLALAAASTSLLNIDPPEHTRLRRFVTPEFTVARIRRLRPRIEAIVAEHLDAMEQAGPPTDLVAAFALPIPSLVICELLGVPYADRADFQRRSRTALNLATPIAERMATIQESLAYMLELVRRQRAEPGDDLLGMLVREHGDELTDAELAGIGRLLLTAGHETTANMLGLGTLALLEHPDQLALLRAEPERIEGALDELLRYLSVVNIPVVRLATRDVELHGCSIAAGELVVCSLIGANRDADFVPEADRLDLTRRPATHVAFGHGIHHCLGAPLARMELSVAFPALLRRFPELRLAVEPDQVPFREVSVVHGVQSLPVTW
jgi:cytochrome P450